MNEHFSVMLNESIKLLNIKPNGIYIDTTLGRAGHSMKILAKLNQKGLLIGFDQDETAILTSREKLNKISNNFLLFHKNFCYLKETLDSLKIKEVNGILMDLGVSSPQFDDGTRGFSYRSDSLLDMRMDTRQTLTAKDIVNNYSFEELLRVFNEYGEDKYSYSIAKRIVKQRAISPINTTYELVEIIKLSKPQKELAKKGHPAKQIFQALRIEVNNELNVLKKTLIDCIESLSINGRLVVISFHSLEDRIVKNTFKKYSVIEGSRENTFELPSNIAKAKYKIIEKLILPCEEELKINSRSKSAKMRIIERIEL